MRYVDVLGLRYAATNYQEAAEFIHHRAVNRQSTAIFALPVHGVVTAHRDKIFRSATKSADLIVPDGQPIKWFMNLVHNTNLSDRVYGPELVRYVLAMANASKLSVFLYGGATVEILEDFVGWINREYPDVNIVGTYRELTVNKLTLDPDYVERTGAQILLCGLGCPKQELWIAENKSHISGVMLGVGAAFSFHSGALSVAPRWMQSRGMEWLFRLMKEPRRLFFRYLITNSYFVGLVIQEYFVRLAAKARD